MKKLLMYLKFVSNKWYINYIQRLLAKIQKKVLQKKLQKVFISRKCIQRKTLHILKTDIFEIAENKNIGELF